MLSSGQGGGRLLPLLDANYNSMLQEHPGEHISNDALKALAVEVGKGKGNRHSSLWHHDILSSQGQGQRW